jgi:DNA-binding CsgD family transcriptional regulator/tetratricopeptide (TPR) repeat protein
MLPVRNASVESVRGITIRFVGGQGFAGRARERTAVQKLLSAVAGGVGGVLLVVGEQGIGKSALLRAELTEARTLGCWVGWGAADELRQGFPLGVMAECLGAEGRRALADGGDSSAGWAVLGGDPVLAGTERLLAVVDRLCAASPVVLVAEDLQWADEASLTVWRRLAQAVGQLPLLLVGSLRGVPTREEVARLARGVALSGELVLELGPLAGEEVTELAAVLLGAPPGRRLAGALEQAGGNPLYVRELADALVRDGRVRVADGLAEFAGEETGGVRVPVSLAAAIGERLAGLAPDVAQVLRWAAVLGDEFSVTDLELVTGWPAGRLAGVVEQALAAGVVAQAGSRLGFRHGLIRQVLYEAVAAPVREGLHAQAARALAAAGAPAERVAAQLVAAPGADVGWVWAWLADAVELLVYRAPQVAARLLRRALAQIPPADPRREVLETALVTVARLLMRFEEVKQVAGPLLARTADPGRAAQIAWLLADACGRTGQRGEAMAVLEEALARPGTNEMWAARLYARQGMTAAEQGELERSGELAARALAGAERTGDRFAAGYALHIRSYLAACRRDHVGMLDSIERALTVTAGDPQMTDLRLLLLANKAAWLENVDRIAEAGAIVREALVLGEQSGTPRLALIYTAAADYYIEIGQWDDALAALETIEMPEVDCIPILWHGQAALIAAHRDDWDRAEEHLAAVSDQDLDSPANRSVSYCLLRARALAADRDGRPEAGVAMLAPCLEPKVAEEMQERILLLPLLTRLALSVGDLATATAAADGADQEVASGPLPAITAAAGLCRGLVAGDPQAVLAAAAYCESAGRPFDRAQALEDAAVLLAAQGDVRSARRAFNDATRLYAELGATWDLRRADTRLRRYDIRRGRVGRRTRPAQGWDALTPTETKIARLVAAGRSNPDIAAELFLSRNTVQTHVSHILSKLGVRSRAEIIQQSYEHPGPGRTASARTS